MEPASTRRAPGTCLSLSAVITTPASTKAMAWATPSLSASSAVTAAACGPYRVPAGAQPATSRSASPEARAPPPAGTRCGEPRQESFAFVGVHLVDPVLPEPVQLRRIVDQRQLALAFVRNPLEQAVAHLPVVRHAP